MLANYYKTAVRSIARSRFHAVINIIGLSIGMVFTLLIAAFCWTETRVNHGLRNAERQFILTSEYKNPGMGFPLTTLGPLARALKENYPHLVANYYRFDGITVVISNGDKHFREGLQVGDSTVLAMYGFALLHGDARTALNEPFTVAITEDKAIKFFGTTDVVGKNLTIDNFSGKRSDFRVTAVLKKPSRNTVTQLTVAFENGIFVPTANLLYFGRNMDWPNSSIASFVELQKGVDPGALKAPIETLVRLNCNPAVVAQQRVLVQPLTSYYLDTNGGAVRKMLYTLSFIAVFILVMAVINFINLSVSRSTSRMKEIGIRKVLGSRRRQLRVQFLTESIVLAMVSMIVALLGYWLLAPSAGELLGSKIPSLSAMPVPAWGMIVVFTLFTGWLAGLYPATLLSSLSSIDALKGNTGTVQENVLLKKALVGFQFGIATIAFVGAVIISKQIGLFFSDRLGYNKEYILTAQLPRDWSSAGVQRMENIRNVFAVMPGVKNVTLSYEIPNGRNGGGMSLYKQAGDSASAVVAQALVTDDYYASTYQIPLAGGVFFRADGVEKAVDSTHLVLNETAMKSLGWKAPREALGQQLRVLGIQGRTFIISGIVRDFQFGTMDRAIQPVVFCPVSWFTTYRYFSFKMSSGNIVSAIAALQGKWAQLMPGAPFEYTFMDESLQALYISELRLRKASETATVLTILIVLLGVIGLVSNSLHKRNREIAIRKVIGASVPGIIRLFVREYLPVLMIAGLAASPLAWWMMRRWLDNYATRIAITVWPFVAAVGCLAFVMIVLIVLQTLKVATDNPVKALRSE